MTSNIVTIAITTLTISITITTTSNIHCFNNTTANFNPAAVPLVLQLVEILLVLYTLLLLRPLLVRLPLQRVLLFILQVLLLFKYC